MLKRKQIIERLARDIGRLCRQLGRPVRFMHICGTHEHTIARFGLRSLMPGVRIIAGPGCPVCVCPQSDIDRVIACAEQGRHILTFGDMMRVPGSAGSLLDAKAKGAAVQVVMGPQDALRIAMRHPDRSYVFFAVGFETTAAPVAAAILSRQPDNLAYYMSMRYVPVGVDTLLAQGRLVLDGMIVPGHASIMSGLKPYADMARRYKVPACVSGFEPEDVCLSVKRLLQALRDQTYAICNTYERVVSFPGNPQAIAVMHKVFQRRPAQWRGIGTIDDSGYAFRPPFAHLAVSKHLDLPEAAAESLPPGCLCHQVILGQKEPEECPLFGRACLPEQPVGPCMVSLEGSCRIRYQYPAAGRDVY